MSPEKRLRLAIPFGLILGLLWGVGISSNAHAQAAGEGLTLAPHTFKTSDGREVEAELGRLTVPENRTANNGTRIELAFVRFKSTNPHPGSPIVYLAGGPGGSGSGTAQGARFDLFMAMRAIGDVIAFDQRGTGLSHRPPDCPHQWSYPLDQPGERAALLDAVTEAVRQCAAYWRAQGVDLAAYNTNESADDLDDLRKALGAEQISLWSISYGTHLALAALKRHARRIDRVVLAGLEGPDHTLKLPSDQQAMLEAIDALIEADPVVRSTMPDFLGTVAGVLDRLDREPVTVEIADEEGEPARLVIGKYDVQRISTFFLRGPATFKGLISLYQAMSQGDFSTVASLVAQANRSGSFDAMPSAMDAASGISDERRARIARERAETLLGDAINFPLPEAAAALGVPDLGPVFRAPVQTDVPALFISGTLDGRTPVHNAEEVRAGFSNSIHLIIDGAGHSDPLFLSSPRIAEVMFAFMKGEPVEDEVVTLPPPDLRSRAAITLDAGVLDRYVGTYQLGPDLPVTIAKGDGVLVVTVPGQGTFTFYPETATTFFMREADVQITFVEDDQGAVVELLVNQEGSEMQAPRVE